MRLSRVRGLNFQGYPIFDVTLPAGPLCIVGENWSGKSTFARSALVALAGEFLHPDVTKFVKDMVRPLSFLRTGCDDPTIVEAFLEGSSPTGADVLYVARRDFRPGQKVTQTLREMHSGIRLENEAAQAEIFAIFGIPELSSVSERTDVLLRRLWLGVGQKTSFFFASPSEKKEILEKIQPLTVLPLLEERVQGTMRETTKRAEAVRSSMLSLKGRLSAKTDELDGKLKAMGFDLKLAEGSTASAEEAAQAKAEAALDEAKDAARTLAAPTPEAIEKKVKAAHEKAASYSEAAKSMGRLAEIAKVTEAASAAFQALGGEEALASTQGEALALGKALTDSETAVRALELALQKEVLSSKGVSQAEDALARAEADLEGAKGQAADAQAALLAAGLVLDVYGNEVQNRTKATNAQGVPQMQRAVIAAQTSLQKAGVAAMTEEAVLGWLEETAAKMDAAEEELRAASAQAAAAHEDLKAKAVERAGAEKELAGTKTALARLTSIKGTGEGDAVCTHCESKLTASHLARHIEEKKVAQTKLEEGIKAATLVEGKLSTAAAEAEGTRKAKEAELRALQAMVALAADAARTLKDSLPADAEAVFLADAGARHAKAEGARQAAEVALAQARAETTAARTAIAEALSVDGTEALAPETLLEEAKATRLALQTELQEIQRNHAALSAKKTEIEKAESLAQELSRMVPPELAGKTAGEIEMAREKALDDATRLGQDLVVARGLTDLRRVAADVSEVARQIMRAEADARSLERDGDCLHILKGLLSPSGDARTLALTGDVKTLVAITNEHLKSLDLKSNFAVDLVMTKEQKGKKGDGDGKPIIDVRFEVDGESGPTLCASTSQRALVGLAMDTALMKLAAGDGFFFVDEPETGLDDKNKPKAARFLKEVAPQAILITNNASAGFDNILTTEMIRESGKGLTAADFEEGASTKPKAGVDAAPEATVSPIAAKKKAATRARKAKAAGA